MNAILTLALKDLRLLLRDKVGFFFIFFFPLGMAMFFGTVFSTQAGGDEDTAKIRVLAVDVDATAASAAFLDILSGEQTLDIIVVANRDEALKLVRQGKATALIVLPEGFGEASEQLFWGDPRTIQVGVDPARQAEAGMLQGIVMKSAFEQLQSQMSNTDAMIKSSRDALSSIDKSNDDSDAAPAAIANMLTSLDKFLVDLGHVQTEDAESSSALGAWNPVAIESIDVLDDDDKADDDKSPSVNAYAVSFPQGAVWAIIGAAAGFGISLVVEREKGTLMRLRTAPLRQRDILAGKALACFITIVGVLTILMLIAWLGFGVVPRSVVLLASSIMCSALAFVGIMMLLSVMGKTEAAVGGIGWAVMLVMAMLGGGMIPLFIMPGWMADLSVFSPVRWAVYALEGAIWRPLSTAVMLQTYGVLLAIGTACFTVGTLVFKRMEG